MTRFNYVARDSSGQPITGTVTAPSAAAVSRQLRQEGKFLVRLQPASGSARPAPSVPAPAAPVAGSGSPAGGRIRKADIIFLTNELAVMTETGVPLADALDSAVQQSRHAGLKVVLADICQRVKSGENLSSALACHRRVFSAMYTAMVRAAEASGTLGVMLGRVAGYLVDEYETRKKVKGAMAYPMLMLLFAGAVTVFLMAFVLPRFTAIYANRQAVLPLPTRVVMAISGFVVGCWPWLLGGLAAVAVLAWLFFRSERGVDWWASFRLRVPLLGGMLHKLYITRCMRTLGTLIGTGVSILEAVEITRQVVGRGPFARLWDEVDRDLRAGKQLSDPMFASRLIPPSVAQMVAAGERTGKLPDVLERVAGFCDRELKAQLKTATAMIEPIMIIVMGALIGGVVLALLLPIFSVSKLVSHGGG